MSIDDTLCCIGTTVLNGIYGLSQSVSKSSGQLEGVQQTGQLALALYYPVEQALHTCSFRVSNTCSVAVLCPLDSPRKLSACRPKTIFSLIVLGTYSTVGYIPSTTSENMRVQYRVLPQFTVLYVTFLLAVLYTVH